MPEVQMPRLSDTMTEGILSRWLKNEGDLIRKGDIIAEIETDKATMELEAYDEGPLTALLVSEGSTVPIGQPIAIIGESASAKPTSPAPQAPTRAEPSASKPSAGGPATAEAPEPATPSRRATPLVRKIAHAHAVAAVCETLPAATDQDMQRARHLAQAGPPAEAVGLQPFTLTVPRRRAEGDR